MSNELDPLTNSPRRKKIQWPINIEILRCVGMLGLIFVLIFGYIISKLFGTNPPREFVDEPLDSTWWEILTLQKGSNFRGDQSFIHTYFGIVHTCVFIDYNPAKTIVLVPFQIGMLCTSYYVLLHRIRITLQEGPGWDELKKWSKFTWPIEFFALNFVFFIYVNVPLQDPNKWNDPEARLQFFLHYVPYLCYQTTLVFVAGEQVWYLLLKEKRSFDFMTDNFLTWYFRIMLIVWVIYITFIISTLIGGPGNGIWDGHTPLGKITTLSMMYFFDVIAILFPAICAIKDSYDTELSEIIVEFSLHEGAY